MRFRIHTALEDSVGPRRRAEWRLALTDLNGDVPQDDLASLTLYRTPGVGLQAMVSTPGAPPTLVDLPDARMGRHYQAYDDIIRRIANCATGDGMRSMETLDYAKKLIHDEAGEALSELLDGVVPLDMATARRLFTLVFLLGSHLPEHQVTFHRVHR